MKNKSNFWIGISFILFLLFVTLSITLLVQEQEKNISFGDFEMEKDVFEEISTLADTRKPTTICNMNTNECVIFQTSK